MNQLRQPKLIVQKYGGSSLATPEHIRAAAQRIAAKYREGFRLVVVVSAMGKMTNNLIALAKATVQTVPQRELDMLLTTGERVSMSLLAMALHQENIPAISYTGSQCGIITDGNHTEARIIEVKGDRIREALEKNKVVIVAGFQGVSRDKEITTLGRGGSDTTAVALAATLKADECEILTDVDGLFTADPNIVDKARLLDTVTYSEALEFAALGAKMHPRSIDLAKRYGVAVKISCSRKWDAPGTLVVRAEEGDGMERALIRGIASKDGYTYFRARVGLDDLTARLQEEKLSLQFFSFAKDEVRFLCAADHADRVEALVPIEEKISRIAIVSVVGDGVHSNPAVLPRFLSLVREAGAFCCLVCLNSFSLIAAVPSDLREAVTRRLHEGLIENVEEGEEWAGKTKPPQAGAPEIEGNA